jgi:thermitase
VNKRILISCAAVLLALAVATALVPASLNAVAAPAVTLTPMVYFPLSPNIYPPVPGNAALDAISNPSSGASYMISWAPVARANTYTLEEANNAGFANPTQINPGANMAWYVSGKPNGAYFYRVRGVNSWGTGPWSNVVSTVVYQPITPNDPNLGLQWGLSKIGAGYAWLTNQGSDIAVAVVDSGVDLTHPDLASKIVPNSGYNFVAGNYNTQDDYGHGTHVAGIIGAATNNGTGVASIGWNATIVPVKVLDSTGSGKISDVAGGINWAADSAAKIINLSLGMPSPDNTLQTAITNAWNKGKLIVVAAGNCGDSTQAYLLRSCNYTNNPPIYPAAGNNVMAAGATTSSDTRAAFSSYGNWVSISAPGDGIYSTYWDKSQPLNPHKYEWESGTSMAAPMVSGLAALVWSHNPALSNSDVYNVLIASATHLGTGTGRNDEFGYGRINAFQAVQVALAARGQAQAQAAEPAPAMPVRDAEARPGVVLLRMKPSARAAAAQMSVLQRYNLQVTGEIGDLGVMMVSVPGGSEYDTAVKLMADPAVEYAEPDYIIKAID